MIPSGPRAILVGAGRMGTHHLRAIERGRSLSLVGIVERDSDRHLALTDRHRVPCATSLDVLFEMAQPECAIVCTPDDLHASDALRCLRNGLHVLVEKPLCPTFAEAQALHDAFRRSGRILAGGMVERRNPAWHVFLEQVRSLGNLRNLDILRSGRTPTHRDSGVLRDLAIHDLDLLWGWLGPVVLRRVPTDGNNDVVLLGQSKPAIRVEARLDDTPPRRRWHIQADLGEIVLDLHRRTVQVTRAPGATRSLAVPARDPLEEEHRQFAAVIRGELDPVDLDILRQLAVLALCEELESGPAI